MSSQGKLNTFVALPEIVATPEARVAFDRFSASLNLAASRETALTEAVDASPAPEVLVIGVKEEVDGALLDRLPDLKILATLSGGTSHIDLEALESRDIALVSIPGANARSVAEHALMLMLALSKNGLEGHSASMSGRERDGLPGLPHEISGTAFGVIGAGYTGRALVTLLRAFTGELLVNTAHPEKHADDLEDVRFVPIEELFSTAARISVNVPLTAETRGLVSGDLVRTMPANGVLVNCSRLEAFDVEGVVEALRARPDLRVGIDAFGLGESPFRQVVDQCMFSPHVAGVTQESKHAMHVALARATLAQVDS